MPNLLIVLDIHGRSKPIELNCSAKFRSLVDKDPVKSGRAPCFGGDVVLGGLERTAGVGF